MCGLQAILVIRLKLNSLEKNEGHLDFQVKISANKWPVCSGGLPFIYLNPARRYDIVNEMLLCSVNVFADFMNTVEPPLTVTSLQRPLFLSRQTVHTFTLF